MSVTVLLNPRSRANRRDPGLADRLSGLLGPEGHVMAPESLEDLAQQSAELAAHPPQAIAIHGGDGTLHKSLTALVRAFGTQPLPPVALLGGGTMNVVAASLGLEGSTSGILQRLLAALRSGEPLPLVERHCLKVGDVFGFVFGNGLMSNFLEEYYSKKSYGSRRALWLLFRTFCSALIDGRYARRIARRFEGKVLVDGEALPWHSLTGTGAATVREVGLGFKLNHRADEDPRRFAVLAIHGGPLALSRDLVAVHRGGGISPSRAYSTVASRMRLEPDTSGTLYTVDGDLYRANGAIDVDLGPVIRFFKGG